MRAWTVSGVLATTCCAVVFAAGDSTADLLTAVRVNGVIVVRLLQAPAQKVARTPFEFGDGRGTFASLANGQLFAITNAVKIEFEHPNPFTLQLSTSEIRAADPNNTQFVKFIDTILAFPALPAAAQSKSDTGCRELDDLYAHVEALRSALRGGANNAKQLDNWRAAVDETPGRAGILQAQTLARDHLATLHAARKSATAAVDWIDALASGAAKAGTATQEGADRQTVEANACQSPGALAAALATIIDIGSARDGIRNLDALIEAVTAIVNVLETYAGSDRWDGNNYLLSEVSPSLDSSITVTVTATRLTYVATPDGLTVRTDDASASTGLVFRRYRSLVPELGAGLIMSKVVAPEYGTTTAAGGRIVVAPAVNKTVSYSGALVLDAVCGCRMDSFAYPMLQFGVATTGSSPGILAGGGVRFAAPKRLAISGGVIVAWIKDLSTLHPGSTVTGTADIARDLAFRNVVKPYVGFLYNF